MRNCGLIFDRLCHAMISRIFWKSLLLIAIAILSNKSLAQIKLDPTRSPESVSKFLEPFFDADAVWPYGNVNSSEILNIKDRWIGPMIFEYSGGTQYAWTYNGKTYFSSTVTFDRKDATKRENQDIEQLFMFNPDRTIAAIGLIKVNKSKFIKGVPFIGVKAMGVASVIPDGMILIVEYMDSAEFLANPHESTPSYRTAILLRLSENNGKLKIEQDDNCLGNPNKYKTISAARIALGKCLKSQ